MLDPKSVAVGVIAGAVVLRGGQYVKEVRDFAKVKKVLGIHTKARTSRAYAKELYNQIYDK